MQLKDGDEFTTVRLCNWKNSYFINAFAADVTDCFFSE